MLLRLRLAQLAWLLVGVTPVFIAQTFRHTPAAPGLLHTNSTSTPGVLPASAPPSGLLGAVPSGGLSHHLLYVLLSGLVASRFGLWLFDLAVTQLQQELVPETELGE
jgi:iron-regulated transporter 1